VNPSGGAVLDMQKTATDTKAGQYSFGRLLPGEHEVQQVGWQQTFPVCGEVVEGDEFQVNTYRQSLHESPYVVDDSGDFVVAWHGPSQDAVLDSGFGMILCDFNSPQRAVFSLAPVLQWLAIDKDKPAYGPLHKDKK